MSDLVVTIPRARWQAWLAGGDCAGEPLTHGYDWGYRLYLCARPPIDAGDRLYVVAHGHLRGFATVTRIMPFGRGNWNILRTAAAEAVTVPEFIQGFKRWRVRWWPLAAERAFPDWKTRGVFDARPRAGGDLIRQSGAQAS